MFILDVLDVNTDHKLNGQLSTSEVFRKRYLL